VLRSNPRPHWRKGLPDTQKAMTWKAVCLEQLQKKHKRNRSIPHKVSTIHTHTHTKPPALHTHTHTQEDPYTTCIVIPAGPVLHAQPSKTLRPQAKGGSCQSRQIPAAQFIQTASREKQARLSLDAASTISIRETYSRCQPLPFNAISKRLGSS
jgi:hypothetical protein